jgi:hypothetical protein
MTLIGLLITLVIVGLLLFLIDQLPLDATIKRIVHLVVFVVVVIWLISLLLPFAGLGHVRLGH